MAVKGSGKGRRLTGEKASDMQRLPKLHQLRGPKNASDSFFPRFLGLAFRYGERVPRLAAVNHC